MKKILAIFIVSYILNAVWENFHSLLYLHYKSGEITEFILLRATLADALMICLLTLPFVLVSQWEKYSWLIFPLGISLAICIELWALSSGRWAYSDSMPLIPYLGVGLTPTIQLGLLGYISWWVSGKVVKD